jgi:hypothetical protein
MWDGLLLMRQVLSLLALLVQKYKYSDGLLMPQAFRDKYMVLLVGDPNVPYAYLLTHSALCPRRSETNIWFFLLGTPRRKTEVFSLRYSIYVLRYSVMC